jgi:hypothetical protein
MRLDSYESIRGITGFLTKRTSPFLWAEQRRLMVFLRDSKGSRSTLYSVKEAI